MEAIRRQTKLRRDPVADIRIISSENAVAEQVETSGEPRKSEADPER